MSSVLHVKVSEVRARVESVEVAHSMALENFARKYIQEHGGGLEQLR